MNKENLKDQINWEEIYTDDFKATCGYYLLRAEQMDKNFWWWCVYHKTKTIGGSAFSEEVARTKEDAFRLAEKSYREHLKGINH